MAETLVGVNHHPHRSLTHRIAAFFAQQPLLAGDFVHGDMVGLLTRSNQELADVFDNKALRLGLGRLVALQG